MISNSMWILTGNQFLSFITQTYSIFCIFSPRILNTTHTFTYLTNITLTLLLLIPFPPPKKNKKKRKRKRKHSYVTFVKRKKRTKRYARSLRFDECTKMEPQTSTTNQPACQRTRGSKEIIANHLCDFRKLRTLWWIWSREWRPCEWIKRSAGFWARSFRSGYSSTEMR